MIELAINTKTADSTMGSQSAASETMRTSLLFELWMKGGQTGFGSRGYSTPVFRSSFLKGGISAAASAPTCHSDASFARETPLSLRLPTLPQLSPYTDTAAP